MGRGGPRRSWTSHLGPSGLVLAALGIVFGDIGTSPLYALKAAFSLNGGLITVTQPNVYGIISLVFWSVTIIVAVKYLGFVMRADNEGEGGILALTALLSGKLRAGRLGGSVLLVGMIGAGLFYGDSIITPAISVMSAIEGAEIIQPSLSHLVVPVAVGIIAALFIAQRFGTGRVGQAFGPVMTVWFVVLAVLGVLNIAAHPMILTALSPHWAVLFWVHSPHVAFVAMGACVLTVTGAESLYADMGHFGPGAIRRAWFGLVYLALILNYLGQGALLLNDPTAVDSPFFRLAPSWAQLPLVVLATMATVIASQAVISGAFSVTNQAIRLGLFPNMRVRHTSSTEYGQIYIPVVNWLICAGVILLTINFRSSENLSHAYGLAVTGTEVLTTFMFLGVARHIWNWPLWKILAVGIPFEILELTFLSANITKVVSGGWLPLVVAAGVICVMMTWRTGSKLVLKRRAEIEGSLKEFMHRIDSVDLRRLPGQAIYLHANPCTAPLALKENVRFNKALHEKVFIVRLVVTTTAYVDESEQVTVDEIPELREGIVHLTLRFGFYEARDIPARLARVAELHPELGLETDEARYYMSVLSLDTEGNAPMYGWAKHLYATMVRNQAPRSEAFHLPPNRTMVMGGTLPI